MSEKKELPKSSPSSSLSSSSSSPSSSSSSSLDSPLIPKINFEEFQSSKEKTNEALKLFRDSGLLIVEGVFSPDECKDYCSDIVSCMMKISPNLKVDLQTGQTDTWQAQYLPPGPRTGLFQALVSAFPPVRKIRSDDRILNIFEVMYSDLRGKQIKGRDSFYSSMDGINVRPFITPFHREGEDWAHLDQTVYDQPYLCVQGQVVLSKTSACFRASPKSLHVHNNLLTLNNVSPSDTSNWLKFDKKKYETYKECVEEVGGEWQVPIRAEKGSVILWTSSTVHSAMIQQKEVKYGALKDDPWMDWRFVVYTCYRPKTDVPEKKRKKHEARLEKCRHENRVTNHWGEKIFPKKMFRDRCEREKTLAAIVNDPTKLNDYFGGEREGKKEKKEKEEEKGKRKKGLDGNAEEQPKKIRKISGKEKGKKQGTLKF